MEKFKKIQEIVRELEADVAKFSDKKNRAAGTRVRKGLQELKVFAQELRVEVQEKKSS